MKRVDFTVRSATGERLALDLPVEVRRPNMALVARTVRSRSVELAAGSYFVTARLPDGEELSHPVTVAEGEGVMTVELAAEPAPAPRPSPRRRRRGRFLGMQAPSPAEAAPARVDARLIVVAGNLLTGEIESADHPRPIADAGALRFRGREAPLYAQLLAADQSPRVVALPAAPDGYCRLKLGRRGGELTAEVELEHGQAELLLALRRQGRLRDAESTADSPDLAAERLLYEKRREPIAAAVGAYALLRFGELARLHEWTENLRNWFGWLPDGAAVRGEHLARLGRHDEALAAFLELPARGLPLFSDGVAFADDRLRLYLGHGGFDDALHARAREALEALQPFLGALDFEQPITTFDDVDLDWPAGAELDVDRLLAG